MDQQNSQAQGSLQAITDFDRDEHGDWFAVLSCGHTQHMRHDPPWQNRPWVQSEAKRNRYLGTEILCKKCAEN